MNIEMPACQQLLQARPDQIPQDMLAVQHSALAELVLEWQSGVRPVEGVLSVQAITQPVQILQFDVRDIVPLNRSGDVLALLVQMAPHGVSSRLPAWVVYARGAPVALVRSADLGALKHQSMQDGAWSAWVGDIDHIEHSTPPFQGRRLMSVIWDGRVAGYWLERVTRGDGPVVLEGYLDRSRVPVNFVFDGTTGELMDIGLEPVPA